MEGALMIVRHRHTISSMDANMFFNTSGKRVRLLRQEQDMNQTELAANMGRYGNKVTPSYISLIEKGDKIPSVDVLVAIAKALDTSADYLLMLSDDPRRPGSAIDTMHYYSPESDRIAQQVDAMPEEARRFCLAFVQQFADHQARLRDAERAALLGRVELLVGRDEAHRLDAALASELARGTGSNGAV